MSSTKQDKSVQPLDTADDVILADSSSDEELSGVSEGDGPLRHAEQAKHSMTFSGDGPENLRIIATTIAPNRSMCILACMACMACMAL